MGMINVTPEAVEAGVRLANQLEEQCANLDNAAKALRTSYQDNQGGLGRHADSISNLLDALSTRVSNNRKTKKLVGKLRLTSKIRDAHINGVFGVEYSTPPTSGVGGKVQASSSNGGGNQANSSAGTRTSSNRSGTDTGVKGLGWCKPNSFSSVQYNQSGRKVVSLKIGGKTSEFPCNKSGMARAYREAVKAGDEDMIARTSAMFEIETLREELELGTGDSNYPQLGGYHKDVKVQDPKGFESHHIPSRSVQDVNAEWLPAISISEEDHKLTSSYSGKQRHVYESFLPDNIPSVTYKESITQNIEKGSSGYIDSVKSELFDLRLTTDHRYDGAVSGYLDAVIDMLASRGIPEAKRKSAKL